MLELFQNFVATLVNTICCLSGYFRAHLIENICSKLVSKCRMQTVKRAIVLLYVSLLRRSNTSCGGGEICRCCFNAPFSFYEPFERRKGNCDNAIHIRKFETDCFQSIRNSFFPSFFSSLMSQQASMFCIADFPGEVDEVLAIVCVSANPL